MCVCMCGMCKCVRIRKTQVWEENTHLLVFRKNEHVPLEIFICPNSLFVWNVEFNNRINLTMSNTTFLCIHSCPGAAIILLYTALI